MTKLGYTIVYVRDVKRTADFWERAFGIPQRAMDHDLYREMDTGGHTLAFVAHSYVRDNIPGGFRPAQNDEATALAGPESFGARIEHPHPVRRQGMVA